VQHVEAQAEAPEDGQGPDTARQRAAQQRPQEPARAEARAQAAGLEGARQQQRLPHHVQDINENPKKFINNTFYKVDPGTTSPNGSMICSVAYKINGAGEVVAEPTTFDPVLLRGWAIVNLL
jgi:hypothetical protein